MANYIYDKIKIHIISAVVRIIITIIIIIIIFFLYSYIPRKSPHDIPTSKNEEQKTLTARLP